LPLVTESLAGDKRIELALSEAGANTIGRAHAVHPAQIALAWLLAQRPWIVPIPGITTRSHVAENTVSMDVLLSAEDLRTIDEAAARIEAQGGEVQRGVAEPE
jgi:aryl-alcohol dehydrogenase-like predicted oxidoreductase